jgi:hypothetical protein
MAIGAGGKSGSGAKEPGAVVRGRDSLMEIGLAPRENRPVADGAMHRCQSKGASESAHASRVSLPCGSFSPGLLSHRNGAHCRRCDLHGRARHRNGAHAHRHGRRGSDNYDCGLHAFLRVRDRGFGCRQQMQPWTLRTVSRLQSSSLFDRIIV